MKISRINFIKLKGLSYTNLTQYKKEKKRKPWTKFTYEYRYKNPKSNTIDSHGGWERVEV